MLLNHLIIILLFNEIIHDEIIDCKEIILMRDYKII